MSYDSVRKKAYQIGVFKALGFSNWNLFAVEALNLTLMALCSFGFYFAFVNILSILSDRILVAAVEFKTGYYGYLDGLNVFGVTASGTLLAVVIALLACLSASRFRSCSSAM